MAVGTQLVIRILGEESGAVQSLRRVNAQLEQTRRSVQTNFGEVTRLARNTALAVTGIAAALTATAGVIVRGANQAFDELNASQLRLESTAKFVGASLGDLRGVAAQLAREFGLSARQANDFTSEVARLTAKAGDISRTADTIRAFLNLGAARGVPVERTLEAVRQAILGIDEGTDRLFGVNPSVLYKRYADAVGRSVGALTDQEKALALVVAAQEDALKVGDAYQRFLQTAEGRQAALNAQLEGTRALLGEALAPARIAALEAMTDAAGELARVLAENKDAIAEAARGLAEISIGLARIAAQSLRPIRFVFQTTGPIPGTQGLTAAADEAFRFVREIGRRGLEGEGGQGRGGLAAFRGVPGIAVRPGMGVPVAGVVGARGLPGPQATEQGTGATTTTRPAIDIEDAQRRARTLLSIFEASRAAGESTATVVREIDRLYREVTEALKQQGGALDEHRQKLLQIRNDLAAIADPSLLIRIPQVVTDGLEEAARELERRQGELARQFRVATSGALFPELPERIRRQALRPGQATSLMGGRLAQIERARSLVESVMGLGLAPEELAPGVRAELDQAIQILRRYEENQRRLNEVIRGGGDGIERTAAVVSSAFSSMAAIATATSQEMAAVVIQSFGQMLSALGAGPLGAIVGAVGTLVGVLTRRREEPVPVRVTEPVRVQNPKELAPPVTIILRGQGNLASLDELERQLLELERRGSSVTVIRER